MGYRTGRASSARSATWARFPPEQSRTGLLVRLPPLNVYQKCRNDPQDQAQDLPARRLHSGWKSRLGDPPWSAQRSGICSGHRAGGRALRELCANWDQGNFHLRIHQGQHEAACRPEMRIQCSLRCVRLRDRTTGRRPAGCRQQFLATISRSSQEIQAAPRRRHEGQSTG